jgi:hypothetical protein
MTVILRSMPQYWGKGPETNYALSEVIESEIRADLSKSSPIIRVILEHSFI